jgi:hypothetical protein
MQPPDSDDDEEEEVEDEEGEEEAKGSSFLDDEEATAFVKKLDKLFRHYFQKWHLVGRVRYPKHKSKYLMKGGKRGRKGGKNEALVTPINKRKRMSEEGRKIFTKMFG